MRDCSVRNPRFEHGYFGNLSPCWSHHWMQPLFGIPFKLTSATHSVRVSERSVPYSVLAESKPAFQISELLVVKLSILLHLHMPYL